MQLLFGTGSAPVFPGEVIFVDGFTVAAGASLLLVDDPFHAANILLFNRDGERRSASNSRTFRSRISNPQPNPQKVCPVCLPRTLAVPAVL